MLFFLKKISNNIEIIVKNISKGYNKSVKTVPIFLSNSLESESDQKEKGICF